MPATQVASPQYSATPAVAERGLSASEAIKRLQRDGPNELPEIPRPSIVADLVKRVVEPLNLALVIVGLSTMAVLGERFQGATIFALAVVNAMIGGVLERRADAASSELGHMMTLSARVIRDGETLDVPARELVRGDVVVLSAGSQVPADVELLEVQGLRIDESMLTGESLSVRKEVGGDRAFSGTHISSGVGVGRVVETGAATRLGSIAGMLSAQTNPTPLQTQLSRLTTRLGGVSLAIGFIAAVTTYARSSRSPHRTTEAVLVGVALALAAVPEGLPTAVTSALAFSGLRLARHGAIVKSLTALEGLGQATVLCTDKTGTLTEGSLEVVEVIADDEDALWLGLLRCNDGDRTSDDVDLALLRAAPVDGSRELGELIHMVPFDPARRTMTTVHRLSDGRLVTTMKGAPEVVLGRYCQGSVDSLGRIATERMERGFRVLAVASSVSEPSVKNPDGATADGTVDLTLTGQESKGVFGAVGLVAFGDPVRRSARDAVDAAKRYGARVVMVTGDNPGTARAVAAAVGMETTPLVTGAELLRVNDDVRADLLAAAAIVARVDPETKFALIDALHRRGEVVAMTGDGVNDAPALQRADIGIAVGGPRATDVARHSAAVVLSDGDLSTVVRAIQHGRRIHRNLRATVAFLLTGNLSEILVIVGCLIAFPSITTPLLPAQLLWINFVTDTFPAVALGIDTREAVADAASPRALLSWRSWLLVAARAVVLAAVVLGSAAGDGSMRHQRQSQIVASLVCCHLALAYVVRSRRFAVEPGWSKNRVLLAVIGGSVLSQVAIFTIAPLRRAVALVDIGVVGWVRAAGAVVAVCFLCAGIDSVISQVTRRHNTSPNGTPPPKGTP